LRTRTREAVTRCGALRRLMGIFRFDFFFIRILRISILSIVILEITVTAWRGAE
jgi:hypothetical protein